MSNNHCTKPATAKEAALFQQMACLIIFSLTSFTSSIYISALNITSRLAAGASPCTAAPESDNGRRLTSCSARASSRQRSSAANAANALNLTGHATRTPVSSASRKSMQKSGASALSRRTSSVFRQIDVPVPQPIESLCFPAVARISHETLTISGADSTPVYVVANNDAAISNDNENHTESNSLRDESIDNEAMNVVGFEREADETHMKEIARILYMTSVAAMGEAAFKQTVAFDYESQVNMSDSMLLRLLQFKKVAVLQKGTAATVYHCLESKGEAPARTVAVKVTSRACGEESYVLACEEARLHMPLDHKNVVKALDFVSDDSTAVLVTEYCGGGNVYSGRWFKEGKSTKALNTKRIVTEVLEAVKYCHSMGVAHRDLKPENILIDDNGTVKLADFGFAVDKNSSDDHKYAICGTKGYMAPELADFLRGKEERFEQTFFSTDCWAVSALILEIITGMQVFDLNLLGRRKSYMLDEMSRYVECFDTKALHYGPAALHLKTKMRKAGIAAFFSKVLCASPAQRPSLQLLAKGVKTALRDL